MVTLKKGFRYGSLREGRNADLRKVERPNPEVQEALSGQVRGVEASDLEERLARAFSKFRVPFAFQVPVPTAASLPGQARMVDFVAYGDQPIEPDGFVGHYMTIAQRNEDMFREVLLNEVFQRQGMKPLLRVPYMKLGDQLAADLFVLREVVR